MRTIRKKEPPQAKTVFVMSGGGARGAAQAGMVQGLAEVGVTPDAFVGTSVGALNAAFLAHRPGPGRALELEQRWRLLHTKDIFAGGTLTKAQHLVRRHPYLFDNTKLAALIAAWVPTADLAGLALPVRAVTTHLGSGTPVYHEAGPLVDVLLASAALPALFPPVALGDPDGGGTFWHVDGGVSDLVPVAGAAGWNATRVFVLDVTVPARLERPRSPLDVLVASLGVAMRQRPVPDLGAAVQVVHIQAECPGVRLTDFSRTPDLVAAGRAAALAAWENASRDAQSTGPGVREGRSPAGRWGWHRNPAAGVVAAL